MTSRVLVLGGSVFLGREVAVQARDAGYEVVCLTRGSTGSVPEGVRHVVGDRADSAAYDALTGGWDAVVDVSRTPSHVAAALTALSDRARHWTFVSTGSVYADDSLVDGDESAPTLPPAEGDLPLDSPTAYGSNKVACEQLCRDAVGDRLHVSRAGLLAGPGDRSDRVGWWPGRFARGGLLVTPPDAPCQLLDVRDLAAFVLAVAGRGEPLLADAVGAQVPLSTVLSTAQEVAGGTGEAVPAGDAVLLAQGIEPFMGDESLPLWLPGEDYAGFMTVQGRHAVEAGLVRRPLADTLAAALGDERRLGLDRWPRGAGLSPEREEQVLRALR